jgi:hypothetical protein
MPVICGAMLHDCPQFSSRSFGGIVGHLVSLFLYSVALLGFVLSRSVSSCSDISIVACCLRLCFFRCCSTRLRCFLCCSRCLLQVCLRGLIAHEPLQFLRRGNNKFQQRASCSSLYSLFKMSGCVVVCLYLWMSGFGTDDWSYLQQPLSSASIGVFVFF